MTSPGSISRARLRLRSLTPITEKPFSSVTAWLSGEAVRIQVAMPARSYFQTYGDHPEQVADLFLPNAADDALLPVVVLIHGGFWRERFRRDLMEPLARDLCNRGVA